MVTIYRTTCLIWCLYLNNIIGCRAALLWEDDPWGLFASLSFSGFFPLLKRLSPNVESACPSLYDTALGIYDQEIPRLIPSTPPRTPDACIVTPEDLSLLGSCPRKTPVPKLPLFSPRPPAPLCVSPHPPLRSPPVSSSYLRNARVSGPFFWSSCHQPHPLPFYLRLGC